MHRNSTDLHNNVYDHWKKENAASIWFLHSDLTSWNYRQEEWEQRSCCQWLPSSWRCHQSNRIFHVSLMYSCCKFRRTRSDFILFNLFKLFNVGHSFFLKKIWYAGICMLPTSLKAWGSEFFCQITLQRPITRRYIISKHMQSLQYIMFLSLLVSGVSWSSCIYSILIRNSCSSACGCPKN